ncbi:hypothetical protein FXO37_09733 [Capsicum annuum]|nr:hypothetical protein FXO37_09733 [Capsicum annuum]
MDVINTRIREEHDEDICKKTYKDCSGCLGARLATDRNWYRRTDFTGTGTSLPDLPPETELTEPEYWNFTLIRTGPLVTGVKPLFAPTKANLQKSFHQQFLPLSAPYVVPSEQVELDFFDAFDPPPCLASNETSNGMPENVMFLADMSELVYDDLEIVHSRSHSLVGLSSYKNQVLKLEKRLTIHEVEHSLKLVENVIEQTIKEDQG